MKELKNIAIIILVALASACKDAPKFIIKGDIEGGKDITFRLVIHTPEGRKNEILASRSGHFEYTGTAPEDGRPVIVEFLTHDYQFIGGTALTTDDKIDVVLSTTQGIKGFRADGNTFSKPINGWLTSVDKVDNKVLEKFVRDNSANPVSTVMLANLYDASENPASAYAVLELIDMKARPAYYANGFAEQLEAYMKNSADKVEPITLLSNADTLVTMRPTDYKATLITFTADERERTDSVVPMLKQLTAENGKKHGLIVDHSLVNDTLTWKRTLRIDSCTWTSVWSGAGPSSVGAARFAITRLPFFVVADSTGTTVYRGASAARAAGEYRKILNK